MFYIKRLETIVKEDSFNIYQAPRCCLDVSELMKQILLFSTVYTAGLFDYVGIET